MTTQNKVPFYKKYMVWNWIKYTLRFHEKNFAGPWAMPVLYARVWLVWRPSVVCWPFEVVLLLWFDVLSVCILFVLIFLSVLFGMTWWSSVRVVSSAFCLFCLGWPGRRLLGLWSPEFFCLFCLGWPGGHLLDWWCPQHFVCFVWDDLAVVCWNGGVLSILFVLFGMTWSSSAGMVVSSAFCLFCLGWSGGRLLGWWCPQLFVCFVWDELMVVCWSGGVLSFSFCFVFLDDLVVVCWDGVVLSFLFVLFGMTWWSSPGMVVSSVFVCFVWDDLVIVCWDGGVLSFLFGMTWWSSAEVVVSSVLRLFYSGWPGGRLLECWCPLPFLCFFLGGGGWDDLVVACWGGVLSFLFVLYWMTLWSSAWMVVSSAFCLFCLGWPVGRLLGWFASAFVFVLFGMTWWSSAGMLMSSSFCLFCMGWPRGRLLGWWCPQLFVCFVLDDLVVVCWDGGVLSFLFVLYWMTWWSSAGMVVSSAFCLFCLGWPGVRLLGWWCPQTFFFFFFLMTWWSSAGMLMSSSCCLFCFGLPGGRLLG